MSRAVFEGRLLVTGGSGFLGREVVKAALAGGCDVVATYFAHEPIERDGRVRWVRLDLRDGGAIDALIGGMLDDPADAVIHTAYLERGPDLRAVTAGGSERIAVASRRLGARLVHVSTDLVFDGTTTTSYREEDTRGPLQDYGRAKAAAEEAVEREDPAAVLVRTSLIYRGPAGRGPLSRHECDVLTAVDSRSTDSVFFTDEWRNPVQVTDLADALIELVVRSEVHGPLHVAGADVVSRHEFARLVAGAYGRDPARVLAGLSSAILPPRPQNCALDTTRARTRLTTRLRGAQEVLRPAG